MKNKRKTKYLDTLVTESCAEYLDNAKKGCDITFIRKTYTPKSVEMGSRSDVSWISTDVNDRTNEVALPEGFILDEFLKNPVVLYLHNQENPCGLCEWVKAVDGGLKAKTVYPSAPPDYDGCWLADEVWAKVQAGLAKGKSIGAFVLEMRKPTGEELSKRPDWEGATILSKLLLNEYSVCTIPTNQDSLIVSISTEPDKVAAQVIQAIVENPSKQVIKQLNLTPKTSRKQIEARFLNALDKVNLDIEKLLEKAVDKAIHDFKNRFKV